MKKFTKALLVCLTLLSLMPTTKVRASHCAGAELLYEWVSDSTYRLYYKFYRDCVGIPQPASVVACYYTTCSPNQFYSVTLNPVVGLLPPPNPRGLNNGDDVSYLCPGLQSTCTDPSSALPGYQAWWYTATVTLPSRCDHWTFEVSNSARNAAITNLCNPSSQSLYVSTTLDNLDAQGDSSPNFSTLPVPYTCINEPYTYNNGAYDVNNDSLHFDMINPLTGGCGAGSNPTAIGFAYSNPTPALACPPGDTDNFNLLNNPLACAYTFQFNNNTGSMYFIPTEQQRAVLAVRVTEYRKINGVPKKIGTVERDIQMVIVPCSNELPNFNIQSNTLTGGTLDPVSGTIFACSLNPLHFCYTANSANPTSLLIASDNHGTVIPGANVIYSGPPDSLKGCFTWTPQPTDTGEKVYTILVKDSSCTPSSGGYILQQVYTIPIFIFPQTAILNDTTICSGDAANLQAVGGSDFVWDVLPGGSPLSTLSCTSCSNPTARPTVTTQYTVTANSDLYCKNKDTVTVTVIPSIKVSSVDTTTCVNNSLQLNVNIVAPPPGNLYTVSWSPATFLSNPNIANPIISNDTATTQYIVTVASTTYGHCTVFDTMNVKVLRGFKLHNNDTDICKGSFVQVNATGSAYNYSWIPTQGVSDPTFIAPTITPDTSRRYVLTASYPGCRDSVQSFYISVQPVPVVVAGANKTICSGDTAQLHASVSPPYVYSYLWTPDSSLNVDSSISVIFSGPNTTTFHFTATTSAGCKGTDSLTVRVLKHSFLVVSSDTAVCPHDSLNIHVTGDSLKSFYWNPNYAISDTTNPNPKIYPVGNVRYTVYAKDSSNCRDTASVYVTLRPAAVISLPDSVTLYPGDSVQLDPLTNCLYFTWFPPLGLDNSTISNPTAKPGVSTRYKLTGITEFGCSTVDSIDVFVAPDSYIALPNAFVPGTGPNSQLKVLHLGNATLTSFHIFNRWGVEVFQSTDINKGWDGTYGGQPQPMGVYVYTVEAKTFKGKIITKQGNITLLR